MEALLHKDSRGKNLDAENNAEEQIKILIIDDNRDLANILRSLLDHLFYTTFVAYDEKQATEKIKRIKPDLVLCDIGLPNRGAYKITDKIRSDISLSHTFLVGLTYNTQDKFKLIAMELGFDTYISKPIQASLLCEILDKVERRKAQGGENLPLSNTRPQGYVVG